MRKLSEITAPILPAAPAGRSYDRRLVRATFAGVTCIVLVRHRETEKALLVSTDGDAVGAVWVPKSMLGLEKLEKVDRGRFIVATVSKAFAGQKRIDVGHFTQEWCDRLLPEERAQFAEAQDAAKRIRRQYLELAGYRTPMARSNGRDAFA